MRCPDCGRPKVARRCYGGGSWTSQGRVWIAAKDDETVSGCCIDGWVPGESGVERCDTCKRFEDDDAARQYLAATLATVRRANSMEGPAAWELHATGNHPFNFTNDGAEWLANRWSGKS